MRPTDARGGVGRWKLSSSSGDGGARRAATLHAAEVPLRVAEGCPEIAALCRRALAIGMPASASDAGVGAGMARAAAVGAAMNVAINLPWTENPDRMREIFMEEAKLNPLVYPNIRPIRKEKRPRRAGKS